MKKQAKQWIARQGDVLIYRVDEIPSNVTSVKRDHDNVVLAYGEVTGHSHRIPSRHASLYRSEDDARYLRVMGPAPVSLLHEEHTAVKIPPGNYRVSIHAEYQPGELPRTVMD